MDDGTRLALRALIQGLQNSGQLGAQALVVIADELRYASRAAREMLLESDGIQIERLAQEIHVPRIGGFPTSDADGRTALWARTDVGMPRTRQR